MACSDNVETVAVPNTLAKQMGLNVAWLNHQEFASFALGNEKQKRRNLQQAVVEINLMKPDFVLGEPQISAMVYECSRVFNVLQRRRFGLLGGQTQIIDFVEISHQYRSSIRQTLERINKLVGANTDEECVNSELMRMLYIVECVWHLTEFLILDSNAASGSIITSMLEWIRYHFPTPQLEATELLQSGTEYFEKERNYWPVVRALIVQGQTMIVRTMLRLHSNAGSDCFQTADQLLRSLPIYSVQDGLSVHKYKIHLQCWRDNVQMLLQTGKFGAEPQLEDVLRLVSGDREAWRVQLREATCWYEYLPGFLLYTDSSCRSYQLGQYANSWLMEYLAVHKLQPDDSRVTFLDRLVLSVMSNNTLELIMSLQQILDNQWTAVHITDLLYHAGLLEDINETETGQHRAGAEGVPDGKSIRDGILYEFGCMLMSEGTYWSIGLNYLEFSTTEGLGAREALLARIPIRHEAQATKLLAIARKNNFTDVVAQICKVLTKRYLARHKYDSALDWAIRGGDSSYVRDVTNILLEHYCNTGELLHQKMIANIGSKMFISSRLVFLKKYYDFRELYRNLEYAKAAALLVSLIDSHIVPSYFWPCLMADVLPLLEFKEPIIPTRETEIVLKYLQTDLVPMLERRKEAIQRQKQQQNPGTSVHEQAASGRTDVYPGIASSSTATEPIDEDETALIPKFSSNLLNNCTEDLVDLLQLACIRNLSRAYIIEKTGND